MRRSDRTPGPQSNTGAGASAPCPLCGCLKHIEDTTPLFQGSHPIHLCPRCGRRFDDRQVVCPGCGSPGEFLGDVVVPGQRLYAQYRCYECDQGFMIRINDND